MFSEWRVPFLRQRTKCMLRVKEVRAYYADSFGKSNRDKKANILIFAQGRSGTTLFEELLCSTGYFVGHHEALNTVTREVIWPTRFIRGLGRASPERVIVHVKPEHLGKARKTPIDPQMFLTALVDDGWFIVHIARIDLLRQLLSKHVAKIRGGFHKTDDQKETFSFHIPPETLIEQYEARKYHYAHECLQLRDIPHLFISYENDLQSAHLHQPTIDKVLGALGLASMPVSTGLSKINSAPPSQILTNFDEIREAFLARGLEWTL